MEQQLVEGTRVNLVPRDNHLKTVVNRSGREWAVCGPVMPMICFHGSTGVMIKSLVSGEIRNARLTDLEIV